MAITPQGDLFYEVRECSFKSQAIVRFLKNLQRSWKKKLLVIWDGASIHGSKPLQEWLSQQGPVPKVWLARFPPYSPQLNPAEQVGNYLKNVLLRNISCKTLKELRTKVIRAFETLKKRKQIIQSFFKHPEVGFYA